jgi:MFS family permease
MSQIDSKSHHPWRGAFAGFAALVVGLGFGRLAYPALIPGLVQQHWFSGNQAHYLAVAALAGFVLGAFTAGHRLWKLRAGWTIRIFLLVGTASFFLCARPAAFGWFFLWRMFAGVAGGFLIVTAPQAVLAHTPVEERGRVGGFMFIGVGAGMVLAGTLIPVLARHGLAEAWLGIGLASLLFTVLTWAHWGRGAHPATAAARHKAARPLRFKWPVALLLMAYCSNAVGFAPHTVFWVDFIARGRHMGMMTGGRFWTLLGVAAAIGPFLGGFLADGIGFARSFRLALLVEAIGVVLPVFSARLVPLAISSVLVGSASFGAVSLAAGRASRLVAAPRQQRQLWSWMTTSFSLVYTASTWAFSFLFAHTHSYELMFIISASALLLGAILDAVSSTAVKAHHHRIVAEQMEAGY